MKYVKTADGHFWSQTFVPVECSAELQEHSTVTSSNVEDEVHWRLGSSEDMMCPSNSRINQDNVIHN